MDDNAGTSTKKPPMSDEERLKLAQKLDDDLDQFIQSLEKRQYNEGWPEDRWEEEMDKHPFFMKQAPKPGDEVSPLVEGLQKLKYDPEENTAEELANSYREDGNFNFKHKNYRLAIMSYTEGIKANCDDNDLNSKLYNNRSAAHYYLENYRSSLRDCEKALKLNEGNDTYLKALIRAALCCFKLKEYDRCIVYCEAVLLKNPTDENISTLKKKAIKEKKQLERDYRKTERLEKKKDDEEKKLLLEIKARGVQIAEAKGKNEVSSLHLSNLEPTCPQLNGYRVHLDADGALIWPVMFMYPEYKLTEFIQEFNEHSKLVDHLYNMFPGKESVNNEYADWDEDRKYLIEDLSIYFEAVNQKLVKVDRELALKEILRNPRFAVKAGTPCFIIMVKDSQAEKQFLKSYE